MSEHDFETGEFTVQTDQRQITISQVLLYVVEINDALSRTTGLDLMSAAAAGIDSAAAVSMVRHLGLSGRAYIKHVNGKAYVILKGYPGQRPVLTGTRYLASNPKVAKLVLSPKQLAHGAAKMTGIAVVAFAALRVVEHILSEDDPRLTELLGTIATDVVKFGIAAGAGYLAGAAVGAVTTLAAGPIIAAVVVGVGASIALTWVDERYGITEGLIRSIEDAIDNVSNPFEVIAREVARWERWIIDGAINNAMRRSR